MLRTLLILPLCFWLTTSSAVNLDSLWGVWNDKSQSDTNRLKAMYKISWDGYLFTKPDSAFYFARLQHDFAKSVNNKKQMANAIQTQGASFYIRGDYAKAIDHYTRSLKIREEIGDKKGIASSLNNIGLIYKQQGDYDKAIEHHTRRLKIYEELGVKKGIASSLNNIGIIYKQQGDYVNAIEHYNRSIIIYEEIGDKKGIASSLNNIGIIYRDRGNYAKAVKYYTSSLKIKEELGDKASIPNSLNNIGSVYEDQGNYDKAMEHYNRSLKISEELGDMQGIANYLGNIGIIYYKQGDYANAMEHYNRSSKIKEELGDKKGIASSLNNIGLIYKQQGDYANAMEHYNRSIYIYEEIGDKYGTASLLTRISNIHNIQGDYVKALEKSNKALSIAKKIGNVARIKDASENLWKIHKKLGKHKQALEVHELHIEMRDSILSIENKEAIIQQEYKYKYEKEQALADAKYQKQIALSVEREKRQKLITYSAGGGLVMVLSFSFFIFNRLQVTRRQKTIIEQQKELVEEQKKDITDSIHYAENIQKALLPAEEDLSILPEGFVLFHPKDIVSGDFYWMQHHNDVVYLAVCDCTGHGVPGAFMSMIGTSQLDEAVVEKGLTKPNEIFYEVRKGFINALKQTGKTGQQKDGMDAAMFTWDKKSNLQIAAAFNPVFIIRKGEIHEIKPDRQPVGFFTGEQKPFTHHEYKLEKGDTLYIFSDGYPDQFGGEKGKKFKMANFKNLLLSIQDKSINEQKTILEETMAEWKGDTEQVDDILVIGVRF